MTRADSPVFCTFCDTAFLPRALALYRSMERHLPEFTLWILCWDEEAFGALSALKLNRARLVRAAELEAADPGLVEVRGRRSRIEYLLTALPSWLQHLFASRPELTRLTYIDADLYFFSDPSYVFEEIGAVPVAVTPHRYPPRFAGLESRYGRCNDGWMTFNRSPAALDFIAWWRERCLEWCFNRVEPGRFTEQAYLDHWPGRGVFTEIGHRGVNAGPWNLESFPMSWDGGVVIGGDRLACFHFSGVRALWRGVFDLNLDRYKVRPSRLVRREIYAPYLRALLDAREELRPFLPHVTLRPRGRGDAPENVLRSASRVLDKLLRGAYAFTGDAPSRGAS